jgi:hypothetical protein
MMRFAALITSYKDLFAGKVIKNSYNLAAQRSISDRGEVMRVSITLAIFAALTTAFASSAGSEPAQQDAVSFAWPYPCIVDGCEGLCLEELLPPGRSVALVGKMLMIRYAKTDTPFSKEYNASGNTAAGTVLAGSEDCSRSGIKHGLVRERRDKVRIHAPKRVGSVIRAWPPHFVLAVMGIDRAVVRRVPISDDESTLPGHVELKARVLESSIYNPCMTDRMWGFETQIGSRHPKKDIRPRKVLRVGDSAIRIFDTGHGPIIMSRNNDVFRLRGNFAFGGHVFFSVNEKLYLTYESYDCPGCPTTYKTRYVYDLSGGIPKLVYDDRFQR